MADRVAELSEGTLTIQVYPSGQLGSERECLELLQIGSLAITKVSASVLESFAPSFRVFSLPYLFESDAHRFAVLEGPVGKALLDDTAPYRFIGLAYYDAGSRSFYTSSRPVHRPADLRGQKIRVQESQTAMRMVRAFGGSPTPISWGELYTALQQGVVDGAENNPPSFFLSRHYEVAPYYVLNEHSAVPDVLVIGTTAWHALSEEQQGWLQQAADESAVLQARLWKEATEEALTAVAAAGVEVIRLTDEERARFAEEVGPMLESYRSDTTLRTLIDQIRATSAHPGSSDDAPNGAPSVQPSR